MDPGLQQAGRQATGAQPPASSPVSTFVSLRHLSVSCGGAAAGAGKVLSGDSPG